MSFVFTVHSCLLLFFASFPLTTGISLYEKVQLLETNYADIKEVLECKVLNLETKVIALEAKIAALEEKAEQQESVLTTLQNEQENTTPMVADTIEIDHQIVKNNPIYRTCYEMSEANPLLDSGMYWIDPDGKGIGDDAFTVYCNMTSGSTLIFHDTEPKTDVGHCAGRGCYSRKINYGASSRQVAALIALSEECQQSITYECISAPLQFNGVDFSWWDDKNGESQYFWSGNNKSMHTCQCGIDRNCVESHITCNCDSIFQKPLTDSGIITDKNILPIMRLNFGRTMENSSSGLHTLGPLECWGKLETKQLPSSCEDLWRIGHVFSGFYSVKGEKFVETVHCDFSRRPDQQKFQTWIGYSDVKSLPTYFFVQKNASFNRTKTPIPFEIEQLNTGKAMDLSSGKFTAPRMGTYFFTFTGVVNFPTTPATSRVALSIGLYSNGKRIALGYVEKGNNVVQFSPVTLQSTLMLKSGDQIWLQITAMSPGVYLFDSNYYYTHFTGWLLEEDIFSQ
ncbi:uncharacterized protein LOC130689201 [Daphnia carinata]|uniref:uncharacterized protein LOC130689201 n=1 Tax=Daphnia carinata TaxID=120202 RepID=UPI0025807FB0|nr:uncharacterized protein LOC130689201 [Daphnia carinata]